MARVLRLVLCLVISLAVVFAAVAQESGECGVDGLPSSPISASGVEVTQQPGSNCLFGGMSLGLEVYRDRAEANLLAGAYSNALADYTRILALEVPVTPDSFDQILAIYNARLAANPDDLAALTGYSFAQWWIGDYPAAVTALDHLLELTPDNVYAILFRGSSRLFDGDMGGEDDLARALELAPDSADAHFIVADAYVYAYWNPDRAFDEATTAKEMGLDTPRVNAILATVAFDRGDEALATQLFAEHIAGATSEYVETEPLAAGASLTLDFVPGRSYVIPVEAAAGETLTLLAASEADGVDTMAVLLGPDGALVTSNDDHTDLNAGIIRQVEAAGTYTLLLGSFEGAATGEVVLSRE